MVLKFLCLHACMCPGGGRGGGGGHEAHVYLSICSAKTFFVAGKTWINVGPYFLWLKQNHRYCI